MDLNLLVAFEALYRERNVTRAGRRLGLSQPAASATLGKLRVAFGDPLFVKTPRGLESTERCDALAGPIARALGELRDAVGEEEFDPKTSDRAFRIGAVDPVLAVLAPQLVANVLEEAPNVRLDLRAIAPGTAPLMIDAREIDLAIAPIPSIPRHTSSVDLFTITLLVTVRPDHPLSKQPSAEELAEFPHAVVVLEGVARTPVDDALAASGLARRVGVVPRDPGHPRVERRRRAAPGSIRAKARARRPRAMRARSERARARAAQDEDGLACPHGWITGVEVAPRSRGCGQPNASRVKFRTPPPSRTSTSSSMRTPPSGESAATSFQSMYFATSPARSFSSSESMK